MALFPLLAALLATDAAAIHTGAPAYRPNPSAIPIPSIPPSNAGIPLQPFLSYSIEFSSFPDFAGNLSHPNTFSLNLLNNLGNLTGLKPLIRVGGNTQDYAVFNASLPEALVGIVDPAKSPDYPTTITIGPKYFESYHTWPDTKYIHGFNLGRNSSIARAGLLDSVSYACHALQNDRLAYWELGNEPDLYKTSSQGPVRPANWDEQDYVDEWLHWSRAIRQKMRIACPELANEEKYKYYAPSFAGTSNSLDPIETWQDGLDSDEDIAIISSHNYISGAEVPGVTLQGTLMNHTSTTASIAKQLNLSSHLAALPESSGLPFILGETNSLYNQGRPGLSNTFGAALWNLDFALYCASQNISRVHMHQGTNYRYQSWQPIETDLASKGTKAPYYGNIATAAFLGDLSEAENVPQIVNVPLPREREAAYASYVQGKLAKLVVVNMNAFNATAGNNYTSALPRPVEKYAFRLPKEVRGSMSVQRLIANGSDAVTGVTWDGLSYNCELENGIPVLQKNVTTGEVAEIGRGGVLDIEVPWSSAAVVSFIC